MGNKDLNDNLTVLANEDNLDGQIGRIEDELTKAQETLLSLQKLKTELEVKKKENIKKAKQEKESIATLQNENAQLKDELKSYQAEIASFKQLILSLKTDLVSKLEAVENVESQITPTKKEVEKTPSKEDKNVTDNLISTIPTPDKLREKPEISEEEPEESSPEKPKEEVKKEETVTEVTSPAPEKEAEELEEEQSTESEKKEVEVDTKAPESEPEQQPEEAEQKPEIKIFIKFFVGVGFVVSIQAIFERYGFLNVGSDLAVSAKRAIGMLGNSDYTLSLLLFIFPFNAYLFFDGIKNRFKYIYLLAVAINLFSLFLLMPLSLQRLFLNLILIWKGLPLVLVLVIALSVCFFNKRKKVSLQKVNKKQLVMVGLMVFLVFTAALSIVGKSMINGFLNTPANEQRFWAWRAGIEIGSENLLNGSGPATVRYLLPEIQKEHPMAIWLYGGKTDNLHNEAIDRFAKLGIFGLVGYLFLWGSIFYLITKSTEQKAEKNLLITFGVSLLLYFFFNQFFFSTVGTMFLSWFGLGSLLTITRRVEYLEIRLPLVFRSVIMGSTTIIGIFLLFWSFRYWMADYSYGKASKNLASYSESEKAIKLFPFRDIYWEQYGFNTYYYLIVYSPKFENKELIKENKEFVLANSKRALERAIKIKPRRASNWLSYGSILLGSKIINPEEEKKAEQAFDEALALELYPNPLSYIRIANAYEYVRDFEKEKYYLDRANEILEGQPKSYDYKTTKYKIWIANAEMYKEKGDKSLSLMKYKEARDYLNKGKELERLNEVIERAEKNLTSE